MTYKFDNARILVVEDMAPMLSLTKSILSIFGFKEVIGARNGEEAFDLLRRHDPDIVLVDWLMEPMDGIELTRKIRKDPGSPNPFVPIILMTGFSHKLRVMQARDIGVTEFLVKPFTSRDLYARIVQVIEKPRQFVDSGEFFGPDRRRKLGREYEGPKRRDDDSMRVETGSREQRLAADILKKLREQTGSRS